MDERVDTIAVGDFVQVAIVSPSDYHFTGILRTIEERGVLVSPGEAQLAAIPGLTAKHVAFFPWTNIAYLAVTDEA